MTADIYYHNAFNKDRLIHVIDGDHGTCEALGVLFRLEGFQTETSQSITHFLAKLDRRLPT